MSTGTYKGILKSFGFQSYLWTQFLGAFNDNLYKMVVSLFAVDAAINSGGGGMYLSIAGSLFILPFLLFSGYAGYFADVYNKRSVLIVTKSFEIAAMSLALAAFMIGRIELILCVLFLMALQSTFFSPAKYGILPEMLPYKDLSRANGLLEMSTFIAIILGTALGGIIFGIWKGHLLWIGLIVILIAVIGTVSSFGISRVPSSGAVKPFRLNPWAEIITGIKRLYQEKPLWLTVMGISYFWFIGALLQLDILLLGKEVMRLNDQWIGILVAFLAIGIGIGSIVAGRLSGDKIEPGLVPLGSIGIGIFSILLAYSAPSYSMTAIALTLLGFSGGLYIVPLNAMIQQRSGQQEKGRLIATNNFLNTLGILLASGALWLFRDIFQIHADRIILIFGLLTFVMTAYIVRILPGSFIRLTLWILTNTAYKIRIAGSENIPAHGPVLLVSNHVSFVDPFLIGSCTNRFVRFMITRDYYDIKWLQWFFRMMNAIPVSDRNRKDILQSIETAREELRQGNLVCIFSEGMISRTGNLQPFKRGFERIIDGIDVPVIPVHLDRLWGSIFSFSKGRFFYKWPQQIPYPVTVSFGRPLSCATSAWNVRQAISELSSEAFNYRRKSQDLLHLRFMKVARRNWTSFCMADSTGKELTYGKTLTESILLARWIKRHRREESLIGLMLPPSVGGALANIAVSMAGKVSVNLNFSAGMKAINSSIRECGIKTTITSRTFLEKDGIKEMEGLLFLEDVMKETGFLGKAFIAIMAWLLPAGVILKLIHNRKTTTDEAATIIFTSGNTGMPKGVKLSHYNIISNIEGFAQLFNLSKKDRLMGILPFFQPFGFTGMLWFPFISGFGAVYHPDPSDAKAIGELAHKYKTTILFGTPTFFNSCIERCTPEEFSSLRYAVAGTEKLHQPVAKEFKERFGVDLLEGYACTEMGPVVSVNIHDLRHGKVHQRGHKPGTVGHPIPGVSVKVVNPDTYEPLPPGKEGMLLVKSPGRMIGYMGQPDMTKEVLKDGWYITGDIASLDEDGFITITNWF